MKFGKKTLVALVVAAGLYSQSNAVKFVSTLSDKEVYSITESLSNPAIEQPIYICAVKSPPVDPVDIDSSNKKIT